MNKFKYIYTLFIALLFATELVAQESETNHIFDDIQIDVKTVTIDSKKDTISVDMFLISYQKDVREFKLNTYASQLVDSEGERHFYTSMKMGRVLVQLTDKQNYLHYLLEEDLPVPYNIKIAGWGEKEASQIILVFEDSTEEGKFIEAAIDLKSPIEEIKK